MYDPALQCVACSARWWSSPVTLERHVSQPDRRIVSQRQFLSQESYNAASSGHTSTTPGATAQGGCDTKSIASRVGSLNAGEADHQQRGRHVSATHRLYCHALWSQTCIGVPMTPMLTPALLESSPRAWAASRSALPVASYPAHLRHRSSRTWPWSSFPLMPARRSTGAAWWTTLWQGGALG